MDTQTNKLPTQKDARALVLMSMYIRGQLNDETLPTDRMGLFKTQPFSQWPPEMQEALRPFGAEMIT
ncbi:MAG: hypothetical protein WCK89_15055 [bacterium]